jgi:hypothetical protein
MEKFGSGINIPDPQHWEIINSNKEEVAYAKVVC